LASPLCRVAVVRTEKAFDSLSAAKRPLAICSPKRLNQLVADALIPLTIIVGHELGYRAAKMPLFGPSTPDTSPHVPRAASSTRTAPASPPRPWAPMTMRSAYLAAHRENLAMGAADHDDLLRLAPRAWLFSEQRLQPCVRIRREVLAIFRHHVPNPAH
jgi:hypothetical protein